MPQLSLIIKILGVFIAVVVAVFLIVNYLSYRSDIHTAREGIISGAEIIPEAGHQLPIS